MNRIGCALVLVSFVACPDVKPVLPDNFMSQACAGKCVTRRSVAIRTNFIAFPIWAGAWRKNRYRQRRGIHLSCGKFDIGQHGNESHRSGHRWSADFRTDVEVIVDRVAL